MQPRPASRSAQTSKFQFWFQASGRVLREASTFLNSNFQLLNTCASLTERSRSPSILRRSGAQLKAKQNSVRSRFQIRASSFQISPGRILSGAEFRFLVANSGSGCADFWTQISHFTFPTSSSRSSLEVEAPSISRFSFLDSNSGRRTTRR